jgi:EAL and modified HD-GYP domain-containing signal transduction protein
MQEHPVLSRVFLGYSPMIDRQRAVIATRLTIFPERPDAEIDAVALLAALAEVSPPGEAPSGPQLSLNLRPLDPAAVKARAAAAAMPPVSLNVAGEALLHAVMAAHPGPHLMLEVPAFMATDAGNAAALQALQSAGSTLLIKGRPVAELSPGVLACFAHAIVDAGEGNGQPVPALKGLSTVRSGVRTLAGVDAAFKGGAIATLGWPLDDPVVRPAGRATVPQDVQVVLELISGVDREAPVPQLEAVLKKDPTLAFRLMRYLNSPAFGLSVEINSFSHALMLLGYHRLKRWLALLLASSAKDINAKPVMFAAVRRGMLMEELVRSSGDSEMRSEMFICGVFSLLDRLLKQSFQDLFKSVPVPERVRQALMDDDGPFHPFLELVRAIESESVFDIREHTDKLFMTPAEVNRALLRALSAARALE